MAWGQVTVWIILICNGSNRPHNRNGNSPLPHHIGSSSSNRSSSSNSSNTIDLL
jgi:hypothetical protein